MNPTSLASAEIGDSPLFAQPQSLGEIRASALPQDSYYLAPNTGGYCAYSIVPQGAPTFSPSDFFSSEVKDLPAYFGKPTQLPVPPDLDFGAVIYEAWSDQAYSPDVSGLRWYLVGSGDRYEDFFGGILQYGRQLYQEWKADPLAMAEKTWPTPEDDGDISSGLIPSILEAWFHMGRLEDWLAQNDPDLLARAKPYLHYATEMPREGCASELTEDSYAYYTTREDRIYLLPRSIRLLRKNDFAAVAQTLAHEVAHRDTARNGLVLPSDEMMYRSLQYFHGLVAEDSLLQGVALSLLGPNFFDALSCRRLPMIPEEEIHAFMSDLSYGRSQSFARQSPATQRESIEAVSWLIEQVHREFPPSWNGLLADYVRLAEANHQQSRREILFTR
ncbi:MAG TPA: hypothetical protein VJR29_14225 [bacterium]|nr:hypothetical protein [bacterium]